MPRIKIEDLPKEMEVTQKELREVVGGRMLNAQPVITLGDDECDDIEIWEKDCACGTRLARSTVSIR